MIFFSSSVYSTINIIAVCFRFRFVFFFVFVCLFLFLYCLPAAALVLFRVPSHRSQASVIFPSGSETKKKKKREEGVTVIQRARGFHRARAFVRMKNGKREANVSVVVW